MQTENNKRHDTPVGWTSLEQSICLVTCGLDPKSADMHYEAQFDEFGYPSYEWRLVAEKSVAIENNLFLWRQRYEEPCWSVGKLISIIRNCNKKFDNVIFLMNVDSMKLVLVDVPEFTGATEVEACVNAVAWLLEKGYISKEK